jgi:thioredoxin-related protein
MKKNASLLFLFLIISKNFAQPNLILFEQIDGLQIVEKRNLIVFIHADWCKYCQVMKSKTFKNEAVLNKLNQRFYFIDFNAEEKRNIVFNNNTFAFKPTGTNSGIHQLAIELGTVNNQIVYPVLCVLNEKNEIIFQHNSFLNARELLEILDQIKPTE